MHPERGQSGEGPGSLNQSADSPKAGGSVRFLPCLMVEIYGLNVT